MSFDLGKRIWAAVREDMTTMELVVLLCLADFTNHKTGQCNPSQSTIAAKTRMDQRSVGRALNGLEAKGYIVRRKAHRKDGGKAPCNYIINQEKLAMRKDTPVRDADTLSGTVPYGYAAECRIPTGTEPDTYRQSAAYLPAECRINKEYEQRIEPEDKPPLPPKGGTVPKATKPKFDPKAMTVPDALNADAWHEWIEYRVDRKKPITQLSAKKQVAELAKYSHETQQQMVDTSIANGWQGLFPPKVNGSTMSSEAKAQRDNDLMVGARLLAEAAMRKRTPH